MNELEDRYRKLFEIPDNFVINIAENGKNSLYFLQGKNQADVILANMAGFRLD